MSYSEYVDGKIMDAAKTMIEADYKSSVLHGIPGLATDTASEIVSQSSPIDTNTYQPGFLLANSIQLQQMHRRINDERNRLLAEDQIGDEFVKHVCDTMIHEILKTVKQFEDQRNHTIRFPFYDVGADVFISIFARVAKEHSVGIDLMMNSDYSLCFLCLRGVRNAFDDQYARLFPIT